MIYLTIVPGIVLVIAMGVRFLKFNGQTNVLYRFCQLRRNILLYIRENYNDMSSDEYVEIKKILDQLNNTIHYFNDIKIKLFRFSNFKEILEKITQGTKKVENKKYEFQEVKNFQEEMAIAYIAAFAELIPLFRWRLTAYLLLWASKLLVSLGMSSLKQAYDWFEEKSIEHNIREKYKLA